MRYKTFSVIELQSTSPFKVNGENAEEKKIIEDCNYYYYLKLNKHYKIETTNEACLLYSKDSYRFVGIVKPYSAEWVRAERIKTNEIDYIYYVTVIKTAHEILELELNLILSYSVNCKGISSSRDENNSR